MKAAVTVQDGCSDSDFEQVGDVDDKAAAMHYITSVFRKPLELKGEHLFLCYDIWTIWSTIAGTT